MQNINKPGKGRLVFDAAAVSESTSFNELLISGPDYLKSLPGISMRFRQYKVAVKSEIKDMIMRIFIKPSDRDAQRFLWRREDRKRESAIARMRVMLFGAKSSSSTAIYIKKNAMSFQSLYPSAAQKIIENSYMDDYLDSFESNTKANETIHQIIEINNKAAFNMHSWASNSESALSNVEASDCAKQDLNTPSDSVEKVLALNRLTSQERLTFNFKSSKILPNILQGIQRPTKRQFLGIIMSIYDPLGFLLPITVQSRFLMQKIWASKVHWDDSISNDEFIIQKKWLHQIENVKSIKIERCYQLENIRKKAELHVFCDASSSAYSAVCYWRLRTSESEFHISFIMGKSRVIALNDKTSTSRLELQAALMGVRLADYIEHEHEFFVSKRYFWSDDSTVLSRIRKNPSVFESFVANRVGEIRKKTNPDE